MKWLFIIMLFVSIASCKKDPFPTLVQTDPDLPVVETNDAFSVTGYSAKFTGKITDTGSSAITEAGFVINVKPQPTIEINHRILQSAVDTDGSIAASVELLPPYTTFYLRAYAKNAKGIAYGDEKMFATNGEKMYYGDADFETQEEVDAFVAGQYVHVNGKLRISGSVNDVSKLDKLISVRGPLIIELTTQLETLHGLESLMTINKAQEYEGIRVSQNKMLKNLKGLEKLTECSGTMVIDHNDELTSLEGFDNIKATGALTISSCDKLMSLSGLSDLEIINGDFVLNLNNALSDISALNKLSAAQSITILRCNALLNLNGLESITSLQYLSLDFNDNLNNLSGLQNLDSIGRLDISENKSLTSLSGLEQLKTAQNLHISSSANLTDITALRNSVIKWITIIGTGLKNLKGLERNVYNSGIFLFENIELESLEGLDNLEIIGEMMTVKSNPKLSSITSLNKLSEIRGASGVTSGIHFENNILLADFCPLRKLLNNGNDSFIFTAIGNAMNPNREQVIANCP